MAEQGVGQLLEAIAAFDLIEERLLVLLLLAFTLEGPLEALLEALLPLAEGSGLQAALVISRELGVEAGSWAAGCPAAVAPVLLEAEAKALLLQRLKPLLPALPELLPARVAQLLDGLAEQVIAEPAHQLPR